LTAKSAEKTLNHAVPKEYSTGNKWGDTTAKELFVEVAAGAAGGAAGFKAGGAVTNRAGKFVTSQAAGAVANNATKRAIRSSKQCY
jgi:hypothetical protein